MKKILLYSMMMAGLFTTSCDLDINEDPDYPSSGDVTPDLVFPSIETGLAVAIGSEIYNNTGYFAQYFDQMPSGTQYQNIAIYRIYENDDIISRAYRFMFAGALPDADYVITNSTNASDRFAATVLRAYAYQVAVDLFDKIPYSEATQGQDIQNPKWDNGEDVYKGVLEELDAAQEDLGTDPANLTSQDLIFDRDINQWIGFANALRLRMYLRLYDGGVDAATYETKIKSLVDANEFMTADAGVKGWANEVNKRNPWIEVNMNLNGQNQCMAFPFTSYLQATNDPRIAYGINPATNPTLGQYIGQIPGGRANTPSRLGADNWKAEHVSSADYEVATTQPVYFFTLAELEFLKAEVYHRFHADDAKAKAAYEEGVRTDFTARGISGADAFLAGAAVNWDSNTDKMYLIGMQKWVALYYMDHMEAWSEIRRTDIPKLSSVDAEKIFNEYFENDGTTSGYQAGDLISPWQNTMGAGTYINRIPYPLSAAQYNPNTPDSPANTEKVWWDKK